jgi:hypothetical protein
MNPNDCSNNSIQDGGTLVCGTFANPCTGEIIKQGATSSIIYNPASASDVPGSSVLFWDTQVQTWFPKPRYVMNNSTDKWPVNYKGLDGISGLVSAVRPDAPVLTIDSITCNSVTLSWDVSNNDCIPISAYNIYQNEQLIQTKPYTIKSTTIGGLSCRNNFYVTSVSGTTESDPSNIISGVGNVTYNITAPINTTVTQYINNGYTGIVFDVNASYSSLVPPTTGSCTLKFCTNVNVNILIVGGGGGGAAGDNGTSATAGGGGGGGGAITYITNFTLPGITNIQINIGGGGWGRTPGNGGFGNEAGQGGANSLLSYSSSSFISGGGGGGIGDGTTVGYGGGLGGDSSGIAGGYGGGGGGGAYQSGGGSINNGGSGGSGQPSGTNPGISGSNALSSGTSGGNGGASALTTVTLPFTTVPATINLGGGGGGGGSVSGGGSGNGNGGTAGTSSGSSSGANALSGISNTSYGGGGGGGGINSNSALDIGGNGGNGTVIIWWQSC